MIYGTNLNQSLEKIVFIGLNLVLIISIGLPLLFTTTQVISETEQSLLYQGFIQDVDETIVFADQNRIHVTREIDVPDNMTLEVEYNQLVFKYFMDRWYVISRSYRCVINLNGPQSKGQHRLEVNATNTMIIINFLIL